MKKEVRHQQDQSTTRVHGWKRDEQLTHRHKATAKHLQLCQLWWMCTTRQDLYLLDLSAELFLCPRKFFHAPFSGLRWKTLRHSPKELNVRHLVATKSVHNSFSRCFAQSEVILKPLCKVTEHSTMTTLGFASDGKQGVMSTPCIKLIR